MATASITKEFVLKNDKACDRLIKLLSGKETRKKSSSNKYEEGKKILKQRFSR